MLIRVRFAPSPTGYVHVGSLRTALYNFLFARHNKGKIILRIEDTDRSRYVEGAVENLLDAMNWCGLAFDEGPLQGGEYGPYYQSQRLDIYNREIGKLLDSDNAYPCFCSPERLDKIRDEQAKTGEPIKYDGYCRNIPKAQAKERMKTESHVIRMKIPQSGETKIKDIIRGEVSFQNSLLDDQVLIKSDGFPTYHFANVVDDHHMRISHVIRGEEWLPSTPKHALLYRAFGWEPPEFAHLPLLLNADRSKLSKRQGDVAVEDYRNKGILPQALVNFVALLGWHPEDDQEIFSYEELIEKFSLQRVNKAGAVFDMDKLHWFNSMYIRNMSEEDYLSEGLKWLQKEGLDSAPAEKNRQILLAVRNSLSLFSELKEKTRFFFADKIESYSEDALKWVMEAASKQVFSVMLREIDNLEELDLDAFKTVMKNVQNETGVKGKNLWMPVRAAITGTTAGPELPAVLTVLGKEKIKKFIDQALQC